jgi:hypothetical protein
VYPIDPWFESRSGHFSSILMNWEFGTLCNFVKHYICCDVCTRASEMDGFSGTTQAPEKRYREIGSSWLRIGTGGGLL